MRKIKKKYAFVLISVLLIGSFATYNLWSSSHKQQGISLSAVYIEDAEKPEWLNQKADLVVIGKVTNDKSSFKGTDSAEYHNPVIVTDTQVKVDQVLRVNKEFPKSVKPGESITVRTLGGTVDNMTMTTDSDNILTNGDQVLLFLVDGTKELTLPTSKTNYYSIVGTIHGAFSLTSDGNASRKVVNDKFKLNDLKNIISKSE